MRKADYFLLAQLIAAQINAARHTRDTSPDVVRVHHSAGAIATLEYVAHSFAKNASVNRDEFLRACSL